MEDGDKNWYSTDVATFGDRLAAAREAAGMTQEEFSKRLGVKLVTLQKWEDDFAEPRANKLSMVAGLLGVSMSWLINGTGDGIDVEVEAPEADIHELLADLRQLRQDLTKRAEHVGRLENRVRRLVREDSLA